ncbi:MAG: hypothetical protein ACI965_001999, partial [Paraglaciecola sp.]
MSELLGQQQSNLDLPSSFDEPDSLTVEQVSHYLASHPNFFAQHGSLLINMQIPHAQKGTVSLVELQAEQLRKKTSLLNHKLNQLISIAKQNEEIYRIYADLNLRILKCDSLADLQYTLEEILQEQLQLSCASLKPFAGPYALP